MYTQVDTTMLSLSDVFVGEMAYAPNGRFFEEARDGSNGDPNSGYAEAESFSMEVDRSTPQPTVRLGNRAVRALIETPVREIAVAVRDELNDLFESGLYPMNQMGFRGEQRDPFSVKTLRENLDGSCRRLGEFMQKPDRGDGITIALQTLASELKLNLDQIRLYLSGRCSDDVVPDGLRHDFLGTLLIFREAVQNVVRSVDQFGAQIMMALSQK